MPPEPTKKVAKKVTERIVTPVREREIRKARTIIGQTSSASRYLSSIGSQSAYDYREYSDIDWDGFLKIIDIRMREEGIGVRGLSEVLEWPTSITALGLRGSRRLTPNRLRQLIEFFDLTDSEIPRISEVTPKGKGTKIFVSYSHKDHQYLERLMVHLKPLEKKGLIDPWVDTRLHAGDKWKREIEEALKSARVGILLISADFLASDFIIDNELPPLLQAAEEKGTLILPVILKPCRFTREKTLREFQAVNPPDEPLSILDDNARELIYDTIAQRIEDVFPE